MVRDVSRQVDIWHPTRNELDRIGGDTQERDDVWVLQALPHGDHLVEGLGISLVLNRGGKMSSQRTVLNICGSPLGCILTR